MRRRRFLASLGGSLAVAGCTSKTPTDADSKASQPGTVTRTETRSSSGTRDGPESDQSTLSVSARVLQPGIVTFPYPDSIAVSDDKQRQFLRLTLTPTGSMTPPPEDIQFRFDGERYDRFGDRQRLWRAYNNSQKRYSTDSGGWIVFGLPDSGDPSDAALVWPGGEWRPSQSLRRRLGTPSPPLSFTWSTDGPHPNGTTPTLFFSITNDGEIGGRFVAAVNRIGPATAIAPAGAVSQPVPAGETVSTELTDSLGSAGTSPNNLGDRKPDFTYRLFWPGGQRTLEVRIVER